MTLEEDKWSKNNRGGSMTSGSNKTIGCQSLSNKNILNTYFQNKIVFAIASWSDVNVSQVCVKLINLILNVVNNLHSSVSLGSQNCI